MAARGQLAAAPGEPGRGEVVEHQRGTGEVLARQAPLDGRLCVVQPVQRAVQLIGAALAHAQHAAQRGAGCVILELAVGGQLGGGLDDTGHQHGQQQRPQLVGSRAEPDRGAAAASTAQNSGHVAVRQGAIHDEELSCTGYGHTAAKQHLQALDHLGR